MNDGFLSVTTCSVKSVWKDTNQDAFCVAEPLFFYAVADGDGENGASASRLVIDAAIGAAKKYKKLPYARLLAAFTAANAALKSNGNPASTSLCAIAFDARASVAFIGSIGGSRCYWSHENRFYQLTTDTPNMSERHQFNPGIRALPVSLGDTFLLATEGITSGLSPKQLAYCFDTREKRNLWARAIVSAAITPPGSSKTNTTAVVIQRHAQLPLSSSKRRDTR